MPIVELKSTSGTRDSYINARRWKKWKNMSDTTCPAYGLVSFSPIAESDVGGPKAFIDGRDRVYYGYRATDWSARQQSYASLAANGGTPVRPGAIGSCTQDWPARVLVDQRPGYQSIIYQTHCAGPKKDSWTLWESGGAFRMGYNYAGGSLPTDGPYSIVEVWPWEHPVLPQFAVRIGFNVSFAHEIAPLNPIFVLSGGTLSSLFDESYQIDYSTGRVFPVHPGVYAGFLYAFFTREVIGGPDQYGYAGLYFTIEREDGTVVRQLPEQTATFFGLYGPDGLVAKNLSVCLPFHCHIKDGEAIVPRYLGSGPMKMQSEITMAPMCTVTHPYVVAGSTGP